MMVGAGCALVFREEKMISFAENNKKKREYSFPPPCFLGSLEFFFFYFSSLAFCFGSFFASITTL